MSSFMVVSLSVSLYDKCAAAISPDQLPGMWQSGTTLLQFLNTGENIFSFIKLAQTFITALPWMYEGLLVAIMDYN